MKNNKEMEGPKYKKKKRKKKLRNEHVACRKKGRSFLLFKVRLRVTHKKRKTEK